MNFELLLKIGIMIEVKEKFGRVSVGWLDEVGLTQFEKKILLANINPVLGGNFLGRKILIEEIETMKISNAQQSNF